MVTAPPLGVDWDVRVICDASTKKGNPGPSSFGIVAYSPWGFEIYRDMGMLPVMTSNEAELNAIRRGLKLAKDLGYPKVIEIISDSKVAIGALTFGPYFKDEKLNRLTNEVAELLYDFEDIHLVWVPRAYTALADRLANAAFAQHPWREMKRFDEGSVEPLPFNYRNISEIEMMYEEEDEI